MPKSIGPAKHDWTMTLTDTLKVSDSFSKQVAFDRSFSDTLQLSDSIAKDIDRSFSDGLKLSDSIIRGRVLEFSETIQLSDDLNKLKLSYATDSIPSDFENVLSDIPAEDVTLRMETMTPDSLGNITNVSRTDVSIDGYFTSTSLKDRRIHAIGIPISGLLTGYFKPKYTVSGTDYEVDIGDQIIKDSVTWRVIAIEKIYRIAGEEAYRKAIMRRE